MVNYLFKKDKYVEYLSQKTHVSNYSTKLLTMSMIF